MKALMILMDYVVLKASCTLDTVIRISQKYGSILERGEIYPPCLSS